MKKLSGKSSDYIGMKGKDTGEILLYQTEDGAAKLEVRLENETVWLSQKMMAEWSFMPRPLENLYNS